MVERFFSANDHRFYDAKPDSIILLLGPRSSGKTSLLFQFAINSVVDSTYRSVVFICSRRKLDAKPPFISQGVDPSSPLFDRIRMKYVEDDEGINNFFAAFHLHDTFPVSVIIDDFGDFFDERNCNLKYNSPRGRELAIVRALALCRNAINHANETVPCKLILSDTYHGDNRGLQYIYKRWASSIYTITGSGDGSFLLKNNAHTSSTSLETERTRTAKYSIALRYLVLEGINENEEQV